MRILLAEDDAMIGQAIHDALRDAALTVDWVHDGAMALSTLGHQHYDALLLDLGLPGKDGFAVLHSLRARGSELPVLIITARDALDDRVHGLDGGADDYVIKPFAMAELLARLRAVSRRRAGNAFPLLDNGVLTLDPATRQATRRGAETTQLSAREFALLHALMLRPGTLLSRSELEDRIYGFGEEVESNAVEYLIYALRRKLGQDAIRNVRGIGWMVSRNG